MVVLFCFVFINFCHVYKRVLERIKSKRWEDGFIILLTLFYLVKLFDSQTKIVIVSTDSLNLAYASFVLMVAFEVSSGINWAIYAKNVFSQLDFSSTFKVSCLYQGVVVRFS